MNRSHPLRRPSTGSLSSLARSTDRNTSSPSGLDFLRNPLSDLNDEAATLASHISQLTELHNALGTFNESFAGYLYALKMNAFCLEWTQQPNELSFARLEVLEKQLQDIQLAIRLAEQQAHQSHSVDLASSPSHPSTNAGQGDMTYATAYSEDQPPAKKGPVRQSTVGAGTGVKKAPSAAAKKQALSKKKQREAEISAVIDTLPLEYRGNQPDLRLMMEKVISSLMDAPEGLPMKALISATLPQTKVNKCLITLVAKKLVSKPTIGFRARQYTYGKAECNQEQSRSSARMVLARRWSHAIAVA